MTGADQAEIAEQIRAFGSNLRRARLRAGFTQAELSSATQAQVSSAVPLDRAAISRLECGERAPDMPTLLRICAALNVKPTDLLRGIGPSTSPRHGGPHKKQQANGAAAMFGVNLRWARTRAGISQERLALDAKVDRAAISVYENGRREPNLRTVLKLALELEIRPSLLLGGVVWGGDDAHS
ncbi:MAG: helix-turn-helix transcriptional regulator [Solirubrobacteraceae bacterium]